jgi:hypothetical protein
MFDVQTYLKYQANPLGGDVTYLTTFQNFLSHEAGFLSQAGTQPMPSCADTLGDWQQLLTDASNASTDTPQTAQATQDMPGRPE